MTEKMFPIIGGPAIPWRLIAPYEKQAEYNHSQSLERLAERGGLSPFEVIHVLENKRIRISTYTTQNWLARLKDILDADTEKRVRRETLIKVSALVTEIHNAHDAIADLADNLTRIITRAEMHREIARVVHIMHDRITAMYEE